MTERLYYGDSYLTDFESAVVEVRSQGGRPAVVLAATAFYPTSGGQPFDTGTLGAAVVVDVLDEGDAVVHVLDCAVPAGPVRGRVDWSRRFEHMQQHTGQHVLSAAIEQTCGVRTESFHLGSEAATIDLSRELTIAEIAAAEDLANQVVWADRPVTVRFVDAADSAALPLRKESLRTGTLRIVDVDGFDVSACGGTHVARTGAIGLVAISGWERFRGGSRLEFRCGVRALRAHRHLRDVTADAARRLSASVADLPPSIERLQEENRELRRRQKTLESRVAVAQAEEIARRARELGRFRLAVETVTDADLGALKTIAHALTARAGYVVVLLTAGSPAGVVVARASDAPLDASRVLKELTGRFGGKGGGRPELAQGAGLEGSEVEIVDAARQLVEIQLIAER